MTACLADAPFVTRFAFRNPSLWWARAQLEPDHLALTGWTWRGRYRRQIPLAGILHVDAKDDDALVLWLADGEALRLRVEQARRWKATLDAARPGDASNPSPHRLQDL